jgi:hypothetical protein
VQSRSEVVSSRTQKKVGIEGPKNEDKLCNADRDCELMFFTGQDRQLIRVTRLALIGNSHARCMRI